MVLWRLTLAKNWNLQKLHFAWLHKQIASLKGSDQIHITKEAGDILEVTLQSHRICLLLGLLECTRYCPLDSCLLQGRLWKPFRTSWLYSTPSPGLPRHRQFHVTFLDIDLSWLDNLEVFLFWTHPFPAVPDPHNPEVLTQNSYWLQWNFFPTKDRRVW